MIDERYLADPGRCPACAAVVVPGQPACRECALPLAGATAGRLWQVCVEASRLLQQRSALIRELREPLATPAYAAQAAAGVAPGPPARPPAPVPPRAEWTPRRVQNLLLALGVGLLAVAAVIFVAVSWGRLGVGGRAAVMTGLTALAAVGAFRVHRRGLTSTAEAMSLLTVALALLDCAGAWASDLAGLRSVDGLLVAAGSTALVAALAGPASHLLRTRALRLSAAVLAQLPVPLVAAHLAERVDQAAAMWSVALTAQAVAAVAVVAGWPGRPDTRDARLAVGAGAALAAAGATFAALGAAYAEPGSLVVGTVLLLIVALGAAVTAELVRERSGTAAGVLGGTAAALTVAAAWAPLVDAVTERWRAPWLAGAAVVLLAAARLLPVSRRTTVAAVLLAATWLPALGAGRVLAAAVAGRLQWADQVWSADPGPAVRLLLTPDVDVLVAGAGRWAPAALVLLLAAAGAAVAGRVAPVLRRARLVAAPALLAAALPLAVALRLPYAGALALDVTVAAGALGAGAGLLRRPAARTEGLGAVVGGTLLLGLAVTWSLATAVATMTVLPVAAAVLGLAVAATSGDQLLRAARVGASAAAVLLLVAEAAAVARHSGAGVPAVWSVAAGLLFLAAAAALGLLVARAPVSSFWAGVAEVLALATVASAVLEVAALTWWRGAGPAGVGLAGAVAVAALLAGTAGPLPARLRHVVPGVRVVLGAAALLTVAASALDGDRLWLALLALGVATAVLGLRDDVRFGWLSGVLLAGSSWVRLAMSEVSAPEAYTVPSALALLVVGWRRRATDPAYRSWNAYAPGLLLALVPSLLRAVTDAGSLRPFLLGVAALAVLAVGVSRRLQAPLVIGGAVLAVDAVVQLAPYLSAVYAAVPRWLTIGTVGLLLLAAGATYEQRVRDLRRVGERVARFG